MGGPVYSDNLKQVVVDAADLAALDHCVDPDAPNLPVSVWEEHLIAAVLARPPALVREALGRLGIEQVPMPPVKTGDNLNARFLKLRRGPGRFIIQPLLTAARVEAIALRDSAVSVEHLFIALIADEALNGREPHFKGMDIDGLRAAVRPGRRSFPNDNGP